MKVSFIIPLYNCLPLTQAMLASLRATLPAGLAHEMLFVDDGSTDGTRDWLAGLSQPTVSRSNPPPASAPCRAILNERNSGFAKSCNHGAAAATGEFLFFLNNDLVLLPGWFEPMLAAFELHPSAGLVGNVQHNFATGAIDHTGIFFNHQGKPQHGTTLPRFGPDGTRAVDALTGACFAVRRTTWEKLGGFDEDYVNGCEDIDLCLRARAAGFSLHVALRSVVRHHISQSPGRKLRDEQNTARLVARWADTLAELAAPAWSREQLRRHAELSAAFDYPAVCAALTHVIFGGQPSLPVRAGVQAALARERARWRELLDGIPAPRAPRPQAPI